MKVQSKPLIETMKDDNKWVRRSASGALSNMGKSAVEPLIQTLKNDDWRVRGGAAWALGISKLRNHYQH